MLPYKEFVDYVMRNIRDYLPEDYMNSDVAVDTVLRNNHQVGERLFISKNGEELVPNIFLNDFYNEFVKGKSANDILEEIAKIRVENEFSGIEKNAFNDYESVKDKVIMKLVNYEKNKDALEEVPHRKFGMKLAAIYEIEIGNSKEGNSTASIDNSLLTMWNVTEIKLFKDAVENMQLSHPVKLISMNNMVASTLSGTDIELDMKPNTLDDMNIMTTTDEINGAATILYPGLLDKIGKAMGENYYIIPSSINEVIVMKETMGKTPVELNKMIKTINQSVPEEEILDEESYEYDINDKALYLARNHRLLFKAEDLNQNKVTDRGNIMNSFIQKMKENSMNFYEEQFDK